MRILLVEPDSATAQSVEIMLKSESFNVYTTDLGEEAIDLGKLYDYDAILLALALPDMSGYEVLRTLRVGKINTPIIIVSGLAGVEDITRGLAFGADAYITKPFHKDVLVSHIHAVVRRSKGHAQSVITTGNLTVNLDTKTCEIEGKRLHLTGKEYQLLELLSLRKGTTLTKEMSLNHLYGGMDEPEIKIIDVFICKLRKKIRNANEHAENPEHRNNSFIETVWGRGYVLRADKEPDLKPTQDFSTAANGAAKPSYSPDKIQETVNTMHTDFAAVHEELGLQPGATLEETMEALRSIKARAERELAEEQEPSKTNGHAGSPHVTEEFENSQNNPKPPPDFENGVRKPVGDVFNIGQFIKVDTEDLVLINLETTKQVEISAPVGAILEIMTYYQGQGLNVANIKEYLFEEEHPSNDAKLGMYMSQAQGALTQLVGREFASAIVQVLSGGGYGMPRMDNLVASGAHNAPRLEAPKTEPHAE